MPRPKDRRAALDRFTPRSTPNPTEEPKPTPEPSPAPVEPESAAPPVEAKPDPKPATKAAKPPTTKRTTRSTSMAETLADALAVSTVADLLGITETALRVRISDDRFPSAKAGRMRVVPARDFDAWLAAREEAAKAEAERLAEIRRRVRKAPRALDSEG